MAVNKDRITGLMVTIIMTIASLYHSRPTEQFNPIKRERVSFI